ncbi:hypothetical protein ACFPYI_22020 [Halomarina salina]|uniref:Twin-arginine translocation signal domain-containing protein n=1 Tax=Halomarina salina TaxID=1872699 RepID=A0ABD5RTS4_9EURY|nr:hypothetical protein [Halomarina salina]
MNRRALLASISAGIAGLSGCIDSIGSDSPAEPRPATPTGTPSCSPSRTDTDGGDLSYCLSQWEPSSGSDQTPEAPPTITAYRDDSGTISVSGGTYYGSSSCKQIGVEELSVTDENDLRLVIAPTTKEPAPRTCYSDMAFSLYEVVISTAETSVETIRVTERSADGPETTQRATLTAE